MEIRYYMAARMESGQFTAHSIFVKSDLRKFNFTWQLDPILPQNRIQLPQIHSSWHHFNDFPLNGKSSTIAFNDKPDDLPQCFDNSIQTSNNDTNTNPSNQYKIRRDDLKKFAILSRANAGYNYLRQLTLTLKLPKRNVMTKFR